MSWKIFSKKSRNVESCLDLSDIFIMCKKTPSANEMFSFLMNAEDDESDFFKLSKLKNSIHSALKSAKKSAKNFVKAVSRKNTQISFSKKQKIDSIVEVFFS